jgi:hypothetical protein
MWADGRNENFLSQQSSHKSQVFIPVLVLDFLSESSRAQELFRLNALSLLAPQDEIYDHAYAFPCLVGNDWGDR